MKKLAILAVASVALVGCERQVDTMEEAAGSAREQIEQSAEAQKDALDQQKDQIEQSADQAQDQISAQAKAEKERLESQAEAQQAQLDAQKAQVDAQAEAAKADAEAQEKQARAQQDQVNEAAGATTTPRADTTDAAQGTDQNLSQQIKESLSRQNADFANSGVTVTALNGRVTLRGTVQSEAQKQALETQVKAVQGVTTVDNQLEVKSE